MKYVLLLLITLAGCVSLDQLAIRDMPKTSDAELCYMQVAANRLVGQAAADEGNKRSLVCTVDLRNLGERIALNKQANDRASAQAYAQAMKNVSDAYARAANAPPVPIQQPQTLTCQTVSDGPGLSRTVCR